jgi:hydroxypyruvate reductase/glycerate 2-kinase
VDVKGSGRGGRNQQLCLRALSQFDKNGALTLLCAGSDGLDGNSDAAGAVIDQGSLSRAGRSGLDPHAYLEANDAYGFFEQTGDLVVTGPSGTNVMDVTILIRGAN